MRLNKRNIERIIDVLQFAIDHYGQTFMDDDVYKACPNATSNVIDLLIDMDVLSSTKDGIWFDEGNIEEYRSLLCDLEDVLDDINMSEVEKVEMQSKLETHLNFNFNLLNIDAGL